MSDFRPDTGGRRWSLVQVRWFSRAVGREGRCRQISLACAGRTRSVSATLGFALAHGVCSFPTHAVCFLRLQAALQGAGPELRVLPRPKPLTFRFSGSPQRPRLSWACVLCLPRLSISGRQELDSPRVWCAFSPPRPQPQFLGTRVQ